MPEHEQDYRLLYFYGVFTHTSSSTASTTPIDAQRWMLDSGIEKVAGAYWVPRSDLVCSTERTAPFVHVWEYFEKEKNAFSNTVFIFM